IEERLTSRFQWGLVANVLKPDYETRLAIVKAKAKLRNLEVAEEVAAFVAGRVETNARELEGAVVMLQARSELQNRPADLALARETLGDTPTEGKHSGVSLQSIITEVTALYNVKLSDLQSKRRHKSITLPRQVCMW